MKFKSWLEDVRPMWHIFVDLDETLVDTVHAQGVLQWFGGFNDMHPLYEKLTQLSSSEERAKLLESEGEKVIRMGNEIYITRARPHSHEFLNQLKKIASDVSILTSGSQKFQEMVIKAHGFNVDSVYGREKYNQIPKMKNSILIDDLWLSTEGVNKKLNAMGHNVSEGQNDHFNHIQVKPWDGKTPDNVLVDVLREIKKRIMHQEASTSTGDVANFSRIAIGYSTRMYPEPITMELDDGKKKEKRRKGKE